MSQSTSTNRSHDATKMRDINNMGNNARASAAATADTKMMVEHEEAVRPQLSSPASKPSATIAAFGASIDARLRFAAHIPDSMPADKLRRLTSAGLAWPASIRDYYLRQKARLAPLPHLIPTQDRIDEAVSFLHDFGKLSEPEQRIISSRAAGLSYRGIADGFRCSKSKIEREHKSALTAFAFIVENGV